MALVSDEYTDGSIQHGIFPDLSHCDLLCFLSIAQFLDSTFLEYTPKYDEGVPRSGGNALVELIYMDRHRPNLQFAFKRNDNSAGRDKKSIYRKLICELAVYEHAMLKKHPNITNLTGITWSSAVGRGNRPSESRSIWPVLGFQPSDLGHLGTFFHGENSQNLSLAHRFRFCMDIGKGLEALHALNIMHGDLKPENVLIFEEHGHLVAKLIDFDCSSFGQTDDSQVSISGTPGWIAPEFARRNARCCLRDARKADIYTYAKLCAWIIFGPVTDIKKFIANPGRIYDLVYETFDLLSALQTLADSLSDDEDGNYSGELISSGNAHTSLYHFFSSCFVGNPEHRMDVMNKAVALLEKAISEIPFLRSSKDTVGRPSHNTSIMGLRLSRLRTPYIGAAANPLTFPDKQELPLWRISFGRFLVDLIIKPLRILLAAALILAIAVCAILFLIYHKDIARQKAPFSETWASLIPIGAILALYVLPFSLLLSVLYWCRRSSYYALVGQTKDDRFEDEGFFSSANSDDLTLVQRSNFVLLSNASGSHALPRMSCLFPLLNRLHYQARLEVVDALFERQKCSVCQASADTIIAQLTAMAFGSLRPPPALEAGIPVPNQAIPIDSKSFELWDANYEATLPDLPRGLISSLQDNRLDQYSFQELPEATLTIFGEIEGKATRSPPLRCTQILYITLSRLCALVGRFEEAQICCANAVCHVTPQNWRAPPDFAGRLAQATNTVNRKWQHRRDVRRRRLQEREQNLFKFSMVDILEAQGKPDEAIDILQTVPNILNSPNGYHYEQEPGHTLWQTETRTHDARNLLIRLLIKEGRLDDVKRLDLHLDLDDALCYYEGWDDKVIDCYDNIASMATALYDRGRYFEASQLQRERLRLSLEHFKDDRGRINQARRDLALSLSYSEDRKRLLEAKKYQDWLVRHTEASDPQMSQLGLNRAFTITQLGNTAEGLKDIQEMIKSSQKYELLTTILCSETMPTLRSQEMIQNAFLRLCTIAPSEYGTTRLISLLCTRLVEIQILNTTNDLKNILIECLNHETTSQSWPMRIAFLDRLLWFMCQCGWSNRSIDPLDEAIELASITLNEAILTNPTSKSMNDIRMIVAAVYTKRALFLYRIQGYGIGDVGFLKETTQRLRDTSKAFGRDGRNFGSLQRDLASLLTEQGAAFHDTVCIGEAIEIYEDLLRNEGKRKAHELDKLTYSYDLRAERLHTQRILNAFQPSSPIRYDVKETIQMLREDRDRPKDSRECSVFTYHLFADSLEQDGEIELAQEIHDTLFTTMSERRGKHHPETLSVEKSSLQFRSRHSKHHYQYLAAFSRLRYTALRIFGPTHFSYLEYLSCYADAMHSDPMAVEEAIALKRAVVGKYRDVFGTSHTKFVDSASRLADMLCSRGGCDHMDGINLYEQCLSSAALLFGPTSPRTLSIWTAFLSQKLLHVERTLDKLTAKITDVLADVLPDDTGALDPQDGRSVEIPIISLARNVVLSTQTLGNSHSFTTGQVGRLESIVLTHELSRQDLETMRAYLQDLISDVLPDYLQPPARELDMQWTLIREGLRALSDSDA